MRLIDLVTPLDWPKYFRRFLTLLIYSFRLQSFSANYGEYVVAFQLFFCQWWIWIWKKFWPRSVSSDDFPAKSRIISPISSKSLFKWFLSNSHGLFCVHCFMFILFFITTAFNCQYSSFSVLSSEKNGFSRVTLHFLLRALPRLFTGVRKPVLVMVLVVYGRIHL